MKAVKRRKQRVLLLILLGLLSGASPLVSANYYFVDTNNNSVLLENLPMQEKQAFEQGMRDLEKAFPNNFNTEEQELVLGEASSFFSINDFIGGVLDTVKDKAGDLIDSLQSVANKVKNAFIKAGLTLVDGFGTVFNTVYNGVATSVFKVTTNLWTDGKDLFLRVGNTILRTVKALPDTIVSNAKSLVLQTLNKFIGLYNKIADKIGEDNINAAVIIVKSILTTGKMPTSLAPPPPEAGSQDLQGLNLDTMSPQDLSDLENENICVTNPNTGEDVCGTQDQIIALAQTWGLDSDTTNTLNANEAPSFVDLEQAPGDLSPGRKYMAKQTLLLAAIDKKIRANLLNASGTFRQLLVIKGPKNTRNLVAWASGLFGTAYAAQQAFGLTPTLP